jgi:chromosome segregation ATPase
MTKPDSLGTSEAQRSEKTLSRQSTKLTSTARIDAPHEVGDGIPEAATDGRAPAATPIHSDAASQQLGLQAEQLAAHLRGRQKELDHREAELNSRAAQLESEARAAQLWINQCENDLISAGQALAEQQQELAARSQAAASRDQESAGRERELARREQEIKNCLARLATAETAGHSHALASAEDESGELRRAAEELATQRDQLQQATADLAQERQAIQRRADHVDQCRTAVEQLRGELGRMHRETLELRLATEELWVQLSGAAPPAALVRSLGRIRAKLADQYRQANAELAEQKKELEAIRRQLAAQHDKLIEHKLQIEQWAAGRREECEKQASRLVAREQELHRETIRLRKQTQRWQAERASYQRELRRLRGKFTLPAGRTSQSVRARSTPQSVSMDRAD